MFWRKEKKKKNLMPINFETRDQFYVCWNKLLVNLFSIWQRLGHSNNFKNIFSPHIFPVSIVLLSVYCDALVFLSFWPLFEYITHIVNLSKGIKYIFFSLAKESEKRMNEKKNPTSFSCATFSVEIFKCMSIKSEKSLMVKYHQRNVFIFL